MTPKMI